MKFRSPRFDGKFHQIDRKTTTLNTGTATLKSHDPVHVSGTRFFADKRDCRNRLDSYKRHFIRTNVPPFPRRDVCVFRESNRSCDSGSSPIPCRRGCGERRSSESDLSLWRYLAALGSRAQPCVDPISPPANCQSPREFSTSHGRIRHPVGHKLLIFFGITWPSYFGQTHRSG